MRSISRNPRNPRRYHQKPSLSSHPHCYHTHADTLPFRNTPLKHSFHPYKPMQFNPYFNIHTPSAAQQSSAQYQQKPQKPSPLSPETFTVNAVHQYWSSRPLPQQHPPTHTHTPHTHMICNMQHLTPINTIGLAMPTQHAIHSLTHFDTHTLTHLNQTPMLNTTLPTLARKPHTTLSYPS